MKRGKGLKEPTAQNERKGGIVAVSVEKTTAGPKKERIPKGRIGPENERTPD